MIKETKYFKSLTARARMLPLTVTVFRCKSLEKTFKHFSEKYSWDLSVDEHTLAYTVTDGPKSYIFLSEESNMSQLVHEISHAAIRGLDFLNIKIKPNNHEILSYYLQFLFDRLQFIIDPDLIEINNAETTN